MTAIEMRANLLNDIDNLIQDENLFSRLKRYVAKLKKEASTKDDTFVDNIKQMCTEIRQSQSDQLKGRPLDDFLSEI